MKAEYEPPRLNLKLSAARSGSRGCNIQTERGSLQAHGQTGNLGEMGKGDRRRHGDPQRANR